MPCIQFATGANNNLKVFTSLVKVTVTTLGHLEQDVGMQNFKYVPAWDEFQNILKIHSPHAFWFLSEQLPAYWECSFKGTLLLPLLERKWVRVHCNNYTYMSGVLEHVKKVNDMLKKLQNELEHIPKWSK